MSACGSPSSEVSKTVTISPTPISSVFTTKIPTNTISISQTPTTTFSPLPTSFKQPTLTQSPVMIQPTVTPEPSYLQLPEWLKNASDQIVLFIYHPNSNRSSEIGFFNAVNGEQAIIHLPFETYQYYWKDTNHIVFVQGYCAEPIVGVIELDISSGTLSPVTGENLPWYIKSCYGIEDTSVKIRIDPTYSELTVEILDPSSGEWSRVTDPNDGVNDIGFSISPNGDYLGVIQYQGEFERSELWKPLFGTQVSVYHLPDRKLIGTFAEEKIVSDMLLFTDNENLIYVRDNTPCIISISDESKKCISAIAEKFPESTIILGDPLKDRKKFSFIYFGNSPHQGGWCIYDLYSGDINCPTTQYADLQGQTVVNYALSPDNNYLLIEYDSRGCPSPWCDYFANIQVAIIDIAGKKFMKLGDAETYQAMDIFRTIQPWRPAP
jgi:hypothetical protein